MSTKKMLTILSAAACVGTAGFLAVQVPAQAHPRFPLPLTPSKDCDWTVFATDSDINQGNGTVVHITWGNAGGNASYGSPHWDGPVAGPLIVKGTNELDFSVSFHQTQAPFGSGAAEEVAGPTNNYSGTIDATGTASGTWNNNSGASGTWTMGPSFKCIAKNAAAAAPPPAAQEPPPAAKPVTNAITVSFDGTSNTTFKMTVKNSSKLPASCNYEAVSLNPLVPSDTTRSFTVPPNGSDTENFDGLKTGSNYKITMTCTDSSGTQTEPLGTINQTAKW